MVTGNVTGRAWRYVRLPGIELTFNALFASMFITDAQRFIAFQMYSILALKVLFVVPRCFSIHHVQNSPKATVYHTTRDRILDAINLQWNLVLCPMRKSFLYNVT
jgi:hypothetical protein